MGYTADCDACDDPCDPAPALLAQFSPEFYRTHPIGGHLKDLGFGEGDTVTLCGECTLDLLS